MKSSWKRRVVVVLSGAAASLLWACEGFNINISFVTPQTSEATEMQTVALPAGAIVAVNNDNGSTRVTVDPAATQATIEITRIAKAEDQAAADALLAEIVVGVTAPTVENGNTLTISAPRPASATDSEGDFNFTLTDDELNITGVMRTHRVAVVKLVITLPPAMTLAVTHKNGVIRGADLDATSTLTMDHGNVRVLEATGAITVRVENGDVDVRDHQGSLDARVDNGALSIDVLSLAAAQQIQGRVSNGQIMLDVQSSINAVLDAQVDDGMVSFFTSDFDHVADITQTRRAVTATLNSGGPSINLRTNNGMIGIRGH